MDPVTKGTEKGRVKVTTHLDSLERKMAFINKAHLFRFVGYKAALIYVSVEILFHLLGHLLGQQKRTISSE